MATVVSGRNQNRVHDLHPGHSNDQAEWITTQGDHLADIKLDRLSAHIGHPRVTLIAFTGQTGSPINLDVYRATATGSNLTDLTNRPAPFNEYINHTFGGGGWRIAKNVTPMDARANQLNYPTCIATARQAILSPFSKQG